MPAMSALPGDVRSSLLAGAAAFVIYLVIGLVVGEPVVATILIAVLLGVVTVAATLAVGRLTARRRQ